MRQTCIHCLYALLVKINCLSSIYCLSKFNQNMINIFVIIKIYWFVVYLLNHSFSLFWGGQMPILAELFKTWKVVWGNTIPICSMYGIRSNIYHQNEPNVDIP